LIRPPGFGDLAIQIIYQPRNEEATDTGAPLGGKSHGKFFVGFFKEKVEFYRLLNLSRARHNCETADGLSWAIFSE
jgi:hypothetical protein